VQAPALIPLQQLAGRGPGPVPAALDPAFWGKLSGKRRCSLILQAQGGGAVLELPPEVPGAAPRRLAAADGSTAVLDIAAGAGAPALQGQLRMDRPQGRWQLQLAAAPALPASLRTGFFARARSLAEARALAAAFQAAVAALPPGAAAGSRLFIDSARLNPRPLRAQLQLPGVHVLPGGPRSFPRRGAFETAFGRLRGEQITHGCILDPARAAASAVFQRGLLLAEGLGAGDVFGGLPPQEDAAADPGWPAAVFDLQQLFRSGLPEGGTGQWPDQLAAPQAARQQPRSGWRQAAARLLAPRPAAPSPAHARLCEAQHAARRCWDAAQQQQIARLKNCHQGRRAVIIGNGPSLRVSDLDRLQDEITFASNKIYLAYGETAWRPRYYSVEDSLVMQNNLEAIRAVQGSTGIFPDTMRALGYDDPGALFPRLLPPASYEAPLQDPGFPAFSSDLCQGIAWGSTIVYSQIQMAAFMGCSAIILLGIDHSYRLPSVKQGNAYLHEGEQNHFHPDYRTAGEKWHQPNLDVLEVSYARARDACAARGIPVLNASRRTSLDVFERADFDSLFPAPEAAAKELP
jgi:hypothetical protein